MQYINGHRVTLNLTLVGLWWISMARGLLLRCFIVCDALYMHNLLSKYLREYIEYGLISCLCAFNRCGIRVSFMGGPINTTLPIYS